jgi:hypothetical protein
MDGRQQEQCNEQYCPCRQGKVRCLYNDIGNSTALRHDVSCAGKNSHHVVSDVGTGEDQTKQSSLFFRFSGSQLGPKK